MAFTSEHKTSNPVFKKIDKLAYAEVSDRASFKGIYFKVGYFLALIILGMVAFLYMHSYFGRAGYDFVEIEEDFRLYYNESAILIGAFIITLVSGLIAGFAPRTAAVTGSIYCVGMGYSITFTSLTYAAAYSGIIIEALLLTVLIISVMAFLYWKGIVKIGKRFRTILYTALAVTFLASIIFVLLLLIVPNSSIVRSLIAIQHGPLGIVFAFIGVFIGAFLVLDDFDNISNTVKYGLDKKYEWCASFGLILSMIYLYFRVLELLARLKSED